MSIKNEIQDKTVENLEQYKDLSIGIVMGGYLDEGNHLMDRKELNRRIHGLQVALINLVQELNQTKEELFQQKFNNKHNLSIDQKISDELINTRSELRILKKQYEELNWRMKGLEK